MQKIIPCLWFNNDAAEAVEFYTSVFPKSKIGKTARYDEASAKVSGQKAGSVLTVEFNLSGYEFLALNGGPIFKMNPSVSFFINFDPSRDKNATKNLDTMWEKLSKGGKALMPLQEYPFSKHYGWIQDKFGVSWQLMLTDKKGEERPFIVPSMMFTGEVYGKAEEATDFYMSIFKGSKRGTLARYPAGMEPDEEGNIMFTDFMLEKQWFAAMESAHEHKFSFSEGISFIVNCKDQKEVDYYWENLTEEGEESQCGWLKDKYGFSWQITPEIMAKLISDPKTSKGAMKAMLGMRKLVIKDLEKAAEGK